MTALWILLGFAGSLLALAAFAWCLGYLVRSIGHLAQSVSVLLPQTGQFLATTAELRDQAGAQTSVQLPPVFGVAATPPWPTRRERGLAPPPVDTTSPTDASITPAPGGDRDVFDLETLDMIAQAQRPRSERQAEGPPGPVITEGR